MSAEVKRKRPRKRRWRRYYEDGEIPRSTYIFPNLLTSANLFSGYFGIVSSINGHFERAAIAVLVSCVFDILDGKVARLTRATSRFGIEYDSLADLVAFGVGPGLLMYLWALKPFGRLGWLASFLFVACGALRLARFNVQVDAVSKKHFVGLPIPGAALMVATTVLFLTAEKTPAPSTVGLPLLLATYILGFLMISSIPYNSFKEFEMIKGKVLPVLFLLLVSLTIIAIHPGVTLFGIMVAYVVAGPAEYLLRRYRVIKGAEVVAEELEAPQREEPPGPPRE